MRTLTNVAGVTYDATKTDVIYAEDINQINAYLDALGAVGSPVNLYNYNGINFWSGQATGFLGNLNSNYPGQYGFLSSQQSLRGNLDFQSLNSTDKTYTFQDKSGTLAHLDDIPTALTKAGSNTIDSGGDDSQFITAYGLYQSQYLRPGQSYFDTFLKTDIYGNMTFENGYFYSRSFHSTYGDGFVLNNGGSILFNSSVESGLMGRISVPQNNQYWLQQTGSNNYAILDLTNVTAQRTYNFPDDNGTLALEKNGVTDTFTTVDGKTISVTNGIITSIV
jgi:hypothetical protein